MDSATRAYEYRPEPMTVQVPRLLGQYLNQPGKSAEQLAETLGCRASLVERWKTYGPENALLSRYTAKFEELTGISLDRLLVIQAKLDILEKLDTLPAVAEKDPHLAWMLQRNPKLRELIDFDTYMTRDEIVLEVWEVAEEIGGPLTAMQVVANDAYMRKWWDQDEKKKNLPRNESLETAIIALYSGFIREDPDCPGRDNARFRVTVEWTLGLPVEGVFGICNFQEALEILFRDRRELHINTLSNQIGIGETALSGLLEWQPGGDRTPFDTIKGVIAGLITITYGPERAAPILAAFDTTEDDAREGNNDGRVGAYQEFRTKRNKGCVQHRVLWPSSDLPEHPSDEPEVLPSEDTVEVPVPEGPPATEPVSEGTPRLAELTELEFVGIVAKLKFLIERYPHLQERLLNGLDIEIPEPTPAPEPVREPIRERVSDSIVALASGEGTMTATEQQYFLSIMQALPKVMHRMCEQTPELRSGLVKAADQALIAFSELLQAARDLEPMDWLEEYSRPDGLARKMVSSS